MCARFVPDDLKIPIKYSALNAPWELRPTVPKGIKKNKISEKLTSFFHCLAGRDLNRMYEFPAKWVFKYLEAEPSIVFCANQNFFSLD